MGAASSEGERDVLKSLVFKESAAIESLKIGGYDFNDGLDLAGLLNSMVSTGFQATNLGEAMEVVNQMINWRLSHEEPAEDGSEERDQAVRETVKCKIFLGFTSNLISSGVRETIRFLVQHRMVDVLVTTAGGIEEDFIKCLAPTFKGDFSLAGTYLRSKGWNRIGNLLVPNENYCKFGDWIMPILDQMLKEQNTEKMHWTPSKVIARLGKEINNESSYLYWASKNGIPVFCPAITDGSIGDMLYLHSLRNPGLIIDLVQDVRAMDEEAVYASPRKTGVIILGGGVPKHHICNANMLRNGTDYAVFINTAQEFDGSDSGARPDEAVSWGKIKGSAKTAKCYNCNERENWRDLIILYENTGRSELSGFLSRYSATTVAREKTGGISHPMSTQNNLSLLVHCDATIAFPLLVAGTFARKLNKAAQANGIKA